jgi:hypothetical protein
MSTMLFENLGVCVVLAHSPQAPAEDEWDRYLKFLIALRDQQTTIRILVLSDGGAPGVVQRQKLNVAFPTPLPVAVVTSSVIARGVVTALSWFYPTNMRAFLPAKIDDALKFLDIPNVYRVAVQKQALDLQTRLRAL